MKGRGYGGGMVTCVLPSFSRVPLRLNSYSRYSDYRNHMPTTVQIDQRTKEALLKYASSLQVKLGRKVTFDEAIATLVKTAEGSNEASERLNSLFGSLGGDKGLWRELESLRRHERRSVERKARTS